jgi:hypothetical protein
MTRQGWGYARVNKFLLKKGGTKVKATYTQDDDLLENDFKHELEWSCSICLDVNSVNPVRVTTACNHVFHNGCLNDYKRVYLQQDANRKKICVPCPLCRAPIN